MRGQSSEPKPLIHPTMARRYREELNMLGNALRESKSTEAREHVRGLIEEDRSIAKKR